MIKNNFFILFSFLLMQQAILFGVESSDVVESVQIDPALEEHQAVLAAEEFIDEDDDTESLLEVLSNTSATVRHFLAKASSEIKAPFASSKKYVFDFLKKELGQDIVQEAIAPSSVVLGAKNIQMFAAFLTHIILKNNDHKIKKLKIEGYSVLMQELYEQLYQLETKDVLDYQNKTIFDKVAKIAPELAIIVLSHALIKFCAVNQNITLPGGKIFKVVDNTNQLLQGQLANLLDGSLDEFISLNPEQIAFGLSKAFLRGATVFARDDVGQANFVLNDEDIKQAAIEAVLPIAIDAVVNKVPLGLSKVNKSRLEAFMHFVSKSFLRQIVFPQK